MKAESRMERNHLGGGIGDRLNAILSARGFNLRKPLRAFARFLRLMWRCLQSLPVLADENLAVRLLP